MKNPFKFGTIVDDEFFTDRQHELQFIHRILNSENHLILISPRRFGKSSLVMRAVKQSSRPYILINWQQITSTEDLAAKLLKSVFRIYPWERVKHLMNHFHVIPTISTNPLTDRVDVSFQPVVDANVLLEDAMALVEKVSSNNQRIVVIFDEFQEVVSIAKGLDKQLRSIMQMQKNLNYIMLGSQESMMTEIFEHNKSPFYHFGTLMRLEKIPFQDFLDYLNKRLSPVLLSQSNDICNEILNITRCHPYYTQQLASQVWELASYEKISNNVVMCAVERLTNIHDLDFERLWISFNKMDKRILQTISSMKNPMQDRQLPTSTTYSSIKRLMKVGYVIKTNVYEIEDPFFNQWIQQKAELI
ncbi:MAG: AAA-like domain-containing protein [Bacteroidaceae bacterium]|nr:AAA-like domain-containing protein [Bacteroidaceae bacterium]